MVSWIRNKPKSGLNGSRWRNYCCWCVWHGCGSKDKGRFSYFKCSFRHLSRIVFLACFKIKSSSSFFLFRLMSVFKQLFWNTVPFLHQKEKLFTSFTFFGTLFSFKCRQLQSKLAAWFITNPVFADFSLVFAFLPGEVTSCKNVLDAGICLQGLCAASAAPSGHGTLLSSWFGIGPCSGLPEPGFLCRAISECPQHRGTPFPELFKMKRGLKNQIAQGKAVEE